MISDIRKFPLPVISEENAEIIEKIHSLVVEIQKDITDKEKIRDLEWQIDYWVFKLYGLGTSEIQVISETFFENKPTDFIISD